MAITGSPDVIVQEEDLSSYVSADGVTTGAIVGCFEWGPVESIVRITSEGRLIQYFGKPYDWNYKDWFTAKNFLQYSSSLAVVRVTDNEALNATDTGVGFLMKNDSMFEKNYINIPQDVKILARYPGKLGNKLCVSMINKAGLDLKTKELANAKRKIVNGVYVYIDQDGNEIAVPKALNYASLLRPMSEDEIIVVVILIESDGTESVQEYGIYSTNPKSTDVTGYSNNLFKYFNNNSNWIYLKEENFVFVDKETGEQTTIADNYYLSGGMSADGELDYGDYTTGWLLFNNEETDETEVQLLMQGGASIDVGQFIIQLAEERKDCLACVSPMIDEVVHNPNPTTAIIEGSASKYSNSSYAFMDGNYKYQYDSYNDVYRWIPLNGDVAGIMAQLDVEENPWMSPGGKQIKNCIKLAFHPSKAERDELFAYNVNPVTNFRAEGNILWGDWTRIDNTAFNFVGVRRLFLYVERAIKEYARNIMWKQNDEITETIFVQSVEPFLNDIVGGRGIQEFKVYAGASVTSPDEMDRGIFRAKILIKPVRSIRYVVLVFSAVRSDMSIEEIVQ